MTNNNTERICLYTADLKIVVLSFRTPKRLSKTEYLNIFCINRYINYLPITLYKYKTVHCLALLWNETECLGLLKAWEYRRKFFVLFIKTPVF